MGGQNTTMQPSHLAGLYHEETKEALRQAVADLPAEMFAGAIPMAERRARLAELDAAIEVGEAELAQLRDAANAAGIVLR
jgi:hypothetical protein